MLSYRPNSRPELGILPDLAGFTTEHDDIDTIADEITEWYTYRDANGNGRESNHD